MTLEPDFSAQNNVFTPMAVSPSRSSRPLCSCHAEQCCCGGADALTHLSDYHWDDLTISPTNSTSSESPNQLWAPSVCDNSITNSSRKERTSDEKGNMSHFEKDDLDFSHSLTENLHSQNVIAANLFAPDAITGTCVCDGKLACQTAFEGEKKCTERMQRGGLLFDENFSFGTGGETGPVSALPSTTPHPSRRSSVHQISLTVPSLSSPDSTINSGSPQFPPLPVFRKQTRSLSQPCIFYPINAAGQPDAASLSPALLLGPSDSETVSIISEESDLFSPYEQFSSNSSLFNRRRMSTPAALSRPMVPQRTLQFIQEDPSAPSKASRDPSSKASYDGSTAMYAANDVEDYLTADDDYDGIPTRRHSSYSNGNGVFTCPWPGCNKEFTRFYNLKSHYRCHSGERPFKCEYCPSTFARNHDLKRHERKHTGVKPFQCEGCKKTFSRNDAMNRHIRISNCAPPSSSIQNNQYFHNAAELSTIMEK